MGNFMKWCRGDNQPPVVEQPKKVSKITEADMVKSNLKKTRDYIQGFIDRKQKQRAQLSEVILQKYKKNPNKKQLLPFLQTKQQLTEFIQSSQTRIRIIQRSISDVQMQQTNLQTIKVLEQSNKFKEKIQDQLQNMNWRGILEQAQQKYESPFQKEGEQEQDEQFNALWKELGGDKIDQANKVITPIAVNIPKVAQVMQIQQQQKQSQNQRQIAYA